MAANIDKNRNGSVVSANTRRNMDRIANVSWPIGTIFLILVLWEIAVHVVDIPAYLLPPPSEVVVLIFNRADTLAYHAMITIGEIGVGFFMAIVVGVSLALMITASKIFERSIYPILVVSQAVPKVALAPLLIVWFGFGWEPKVLVVVLIAFFPIVIDLVAGIRSVPDSMHKLALSTGASRYDTLTKFVVPHALPHFFSGLKVAITLAVSGAIIGEFVGADRGLGYLLLFANGQLDTHLLFACIVVLSLLGVILFYLLLAAERLCMPWRYKSGSHEA